MSAKDIERVMREREDKRTLKEGAEIPMSQEARRSFSAMKPDFAALQKFEDKAERHHERYARKGDQLETAPVINVMGSTAGAGSGDFHTYRGFRAKEFVRLRDMEAERREEEARKAWEQERAEREAVVQAKSAKRAAKREREKQKSREAKEEKKRIRSEAAGSAEQQSVEDAESAAPPTDAPVS